ncbi:hypothetical protein O1611_g3272 [Lasiodiplodia mahajangana]|uniref:Uncharacterized protein n=1 Tax=Lasiodiplodia mahajangana TaxID=1108764 RepID=A0ACC2JSG0_9PEZI|nr:hypothetical protein O1611_g3272 [Lasiodiplodia mahajangana]
MHFFGKVRIPQVRYQSLRLSEESLTEDDKYLLEGHQSPLRSHLSRWRPIAIYAAVAALVVSFITISTLYLQLLRQHAPRPQLTCGTSVAEAKKAGCTFDRLTKAWLPAQCPRYYEEEYVQFPATLNMTNITGWHYWEDHATTKEITDEEMAFYAETRPVGDMSCAFVLMRRADAEEAGERVDATSEYIPHMKHCLQMLLNAAMKAPGIDKPLAEGQVGFGAC